MDFETFERRAHAAFEEIPPEFRERVAGPVVVRRLKRGSGADDGLDDRVTLGECVHAPDVSGSSELHSTVFLYYGSFRALAADDPAFDWEAEIVETVRHEVQHHVEDQVGHPRLRDQDFAEEQNARRLQGLPYRSGFWRGGARIADPAWELHAVGDDVFLELVLPGDEWDELRRAGRTIVVGGRSFEIPPGEIEEDEEILEFEGGAAHLAGRSAETASHRHDHGAHAAAGRGAGAGRAAHGGDEPAGDLVVVVRRKRSFLEAFWRRGR